MLLSAASTIDFPAVSQTLRALQCKPIIPVEFLVENKTCHQIEIMVSRIASDWIASKADVVPAIALDLNTTSKRRQKCGI